MLLLQARKPGSTFYIWVWVWVRAWVFCGAGRLTIKWYISVQLRGLPIKGFIPVDDVGSCFGSLTHVPVYVLVINMSHQKNISPDHVAVNSCNKGKTCHIQRTMYRLTRGVSYTISELMHHFAVWSCCIALHTTTRTKNNNRAYNCQL